MGVLPAVRRAPPARPLPRHDGPRASASAVVFTLAASLTLGPLPATATAAAPAPTAVAIETPTSRAPRADLSPDSAPSADRTADPLAEARSAQDPHPEGAQDAPDDDGPAPPNAASPGHDARLRGRAPEDSSAADTIPEDALSEDVLSEGPTEDAVALAQRAFEEGQAHFAAEDFERAARAFERAHAAVPEEPQHIALFNAALSWQRAQAPLEVERVTGWWLELEAQRAADSPGPSADDEIALSGLRGEALALLCSVTVIDPSEQYTRWTLNGEDIALGEEVWLMPGAQTLEVISVSGRLARIDLTLDRGDRRTVALSGPPAPRLSAHELAAAHEQARVAAALREQQRQRAIATAGWALSAGAAGGWLATTVPGALTLRARDAFQDGLCASPCPVGSSYPQREQEQFERLRTTTNALVITSGVLTAVAIGLWSAYRPQRARRDGRAPRPPAQP